MLLGEVWEDAVTKVSYGARRQYALGDALDSVMNYPLRDALVAFLTGRSTARTLADLLLSQRLNYPQPLYYALMNLTASHDVARARARRWRWTLTLRSRTRRGARGARNYGRHGCARRAAAHSAVAVQFWLPGIPSIYYGDEAGMQGLCDPFNRARCRCATRRCCSGTRS
ncbi:MAG: alpha-amylase family glycosyl hydrolase [Oscillospiraceae bacterium]